MTFIINQALANIGFEKKAYFSVAELTAIERELQQIVHIVGHRIVETIPGSDVLEKPTTLEQNARNVMKHLVFGAVACEEGADILESHLASQENIDAFSKKNNPELLAALRTEFSTILTNLAKPAIESKEEIHPHDEKQLAAFINNLLALYPMFEPVTGEPFVIPKKINDRWILVDYEFERRDISPREGILADLLTKEEDRMYAYALTSKHPQAESYLLFPGTTFDVGQGSALAKLSNFTFPNSSGESHDTATINDWIDQQTKGIITAGISQGAVLAIITAGRYPDKITATHSLNPTFLSKHTAARLLPKWLATPEEKRPHLHIYTQLNDPIFSLEKFMLPGINTHIYRVIPDDDKLALNATIKSCIPIPKGIIKNIATAYEAHVHLYTGHRQVLMLNVNVERENARLTRELTANMKLLGTSILFPIKKVELATKLYQKKHNISNTQKNCALSLCALVLAFVLKEAVKHPNSPYVFAFCALSFLMLPQIDAQYKFNRAFSRR